MAYPALAIEVMLAAPSDLQTELSVMRKVILDWNDSHSRSRQVVLLPGHYLTRVVPEVGRGPQTAVNRQLLEYCDLLVAAFWTRLGTPTDTSESGTVEEIKRHVDVGKPAMLYFSNASPPLADIDTRQLEAVRVYKSKMQGQSLYREFGSPNDLRAKLNKDLATLMDENSFIQSLLRQHSALQPRVLNPVRDLSVMSKRMLAAAAAEDGQIWRRAAAQGNYVGYRAGGTTSGTFGDPRSQADAQTALDELVAAGLVRDEDGEGKLFKLTRRGYEVADGLPF